MNSGNKFIRVIKDYPLAFICLVVILAGMAVIFMRSGSNVELEAKEADLTSRLRTIDQNIKNSRNLEKDVEGVGQFVEKIESRLFDREQRAVNINYFYDLEKRLDTRISSISQSSAGVDPVYSKGGPRELKLHSTVTFSISTVGTFDEILRFLFEFYQVSPFMRVTSLQLSAGGRGRGSVSGQLDARLTVVVLAEKE